jgi:cell wall-associated NlpC family hydrolase
MREITKVSTETGVPWEVLRTIMVIESGGNANAVDHASGAVGLMMVSPRVAAATEPSTDTNLWDPETNVRVVAGYLNAQYNRWGSWDLAVAAWADERNGDGASVFDHGYQPNSTVTNYLHDYRTLSAELQFDGIGMDLQASALWAGISVAGTPYVYGGQSPDDGFDCSGFVWWAYQQVGVSIPRPSGAQWASLQQIDASEARPGDIVAFADPAWGGGITHVGLYAGNGMMLHAPREGQVVSYDNIYDTYWGAHLVGFGRVQQ